MYSAMDRFCCDRNERRHNPGHNSPREHKAEHKVEGFSLAKALPRPVLITGQGLTQYACVLSTWGKQTWNL